MGARRLITITVLIIGLTFPLVSMIDRRLGGATDYDVELGRIQKDIAEVKERVLIPPIDVSLGSRFVYHTYQRAILSGDPDDLDAAERVIERAIGEIGPLVELYLLRANLHSRLHRLEKTESDVAALERFVGDAQVIALTAGLAFQRGRYGEARTGYVLALEKNPTWDNFARLAYWESKFGDSEIADKLYAQAENELSVKEMRSYAWVKLERGLLELYRGNHQNARRHYDQADKAYSGYWLADERRAELLGAERK